MKGKRWVLVFFILALIYTLYFYPIQRYLAERTFTEYIQIQGAKKENIESKRVFKDYKQNGYVIEVVYKDDPNFIYNYKYSVDIIEDMTNYKAIRCVVYTQDNESVELSGDAQNVKYLPIE